jgi:Tfp pilus assembly protein PilF
MHGKSTYSHAIELEKVLMMQESYFENLIELGLYFENSGQHQKAFDIYKKGVEKAEKAKSALLGTMLGLLD